jgi:maltooligosyltrehalose trehalohydrolase
LRLRREDQVLGRQDRWALDGAVLATQALVLRYDAPMDDDRLLVVNLGADLRFVPAAEPLLAPVEGGSWILQWSSEHPRYGGSGILNPLTEEGWHIPAASATLFRAEKS